MNQLFICLVIFCLAHQPTPSFAQDSLINLPKIGSMISTSNPVHPILLKGLKIDPSNPFVLDFILDRGDLAPQLPQIKDEGMRQVNYFLAALTFKPNDLWVNLSPYESNRIITEDLEKTALGRDLLIQDYILKQLASSLTYPNGHYGKMFWQKVYEKARHQGAKNISFNAFNKIWITPDSAEVFIKGDVAMVTKMHLKVMVEEDYLSFSKNGKSIKNTMPNDPSIKIMKDVLIPVIEHEVNHGAHFVVLRQIVNAAILAEWYKRYLKGTILTKNYVNHAQVNGIDQADVSSKEDIYNQYMRAYKTGVYNFIKEEPSSKESRGVLPRKYFAGGVNIDLAMMTPNGFEPSDNGNGFFTLSVALQPAEGQALRFMKGVKNPYLMDMEHRLEARKKKYPSLRPTIDRLLATPHRITKSWEIFNGHSFYHMRDARSNDLGTPKGGNRYVTAGDLNSDDHFMEVFDQFIKLDPDEQLVKAFIEQWIDQETKALALAMTLKTAGTGLNLGGAKATVFIGDILKVDGRWVIKDWDWKRSKYNIARLHARRLAQAGAVGIDIDSPAPDMRTNPRILEVYNDAYLRYLTEQGPQSFGSEHAQLYQQLNRALLKIKRLEQVGINAFERRFPQRVRTPFLKITYNYWKKKQQRWTC